MFKIMYFSFILHAKKTAFVVEHDFIMATYLADRVIVFDGIPSKNTVANRYNCFLKYSSLIISSVRKVLFRIFQEAYKH